MINIWDKKWKELLDGAEKAGLDKKPATSEQEKEEKPNYLLPSGSQQKEEPLLPGLGGGDWQTGDKETGEAGGKSETDAALEAALKQLAGGLLGKGESKNESAIRDEAGDRFAASDSLRENATQKSDTLYDALMAFAGKQDGRYDALIEQISQKGYTSFAGVDDLLSYYARQGDRAAGYAAANGAADNGGNPDSYAAAQAARQRLDFTDAGTQAALGYYQEQLGNWLAALKAAGADATDIYALLQDNVDSTHDAATEEGKRGESLFATLGDLENTRTEAEADIFSALLAHDSKLRAAGTGGTSTGNTATGGSGEDGTADTTEVAISPMEIDREYDKMINPENGVYPRYSATEALIILWKKYPSMHDYLLKKYDKVLNPDYEFKD